MENENINLQNSYTLVSFGSFIISIAIALVALVFNSLVSPYMVLTTLGMSSFLLFFPVYCRFLVKKLGKKEERATPLYNHNMLSIYGLFGLIFMGFLSTKLSSLGFFLYIVWILGIGFFFASLIKQKRSFFLPHSMLTHGLLLFFGISIALIIWASGYQNLWFLNSLINAGYNCVDTLYHAAISNMIKTYGVSSTGINGLVYRGYHFLSHGIFAYLSQLMNTTVLNFYNIMYPIIFIPLCIKHLLICTLDLRSLKRLSVEIGIKLWGILIVAIIMLSLPTPFLGESYVVSIILLFSIISMAFYTYDIKTGEIISSKIINLIVVPVLIGVILMFSKISTGFLLIFVYGYIIIRLKLYKKNSFLLSFFITAILGYVSLQLASDHIHDPVQTQLYPRFIWGLININYKHWIALYITSLLFFLVRYYQLNLSTLNSLKTVFFQKKTLDIEIVLLFCVLGFIPEAIMAGAHHFQEVQVQIGLAFLLGSVSWLTVFSGPNIQLNLLGERRLFNNKTPVLVLIGMTLIILVLNRTFVGLKNTISRRNMSIYGVVTSYQKTVLYGKKPFMLTKNDRLKNLQVIRALEVLADMPLHEKEKSVLFIPHSMSIYWHLNTVYFRNVYMTTGRGSRMWPFATSFIAPAITGMALLEGMPPILPSNLRKDYMVRAMEYIDDKDVQLLQLAYKEVNGYFVLKEPINPNIKEKLISTLQFNYKHGFQGYGYGKYSIPEISNHKVLLSDTKKLKALIEKKGFEQVIILEDINGQIQTRIIHI